MTNQSKVLKGILFIIFFIILSEHLTLLNIMMGILISVFVLFFYKEESETIKYINFKTIMHWISFIGNLFIEVIKANFQVAFIALSPKMPVSPRVVKYQTKLSDHWLLTILANAITLTPGTMTIDIKEDILTIHCLNASYAEGLDHMKLEKILMIIEQKLNSKLMNKIRM